MSLLTMSQWLPESRILKYVKLAIALFTETDYSKSDQNHVPWDKCGKLFILRCNIVRNFRNSLARKPHLQIWRCSNGYSRQSETDQVARTMRSVAGHTGVFIPLMRYAPYQHPVRPLVGSRYFSPVGLFSLVHNFCLFPYSLIGPK